MVIRNLKIGKRLILGYTVILIFSMATSFIAIFEINNIWNDTKNLYERPFTTSNLLRDIKLNALNMRRYMLDMALLKDEKEINDLANEIDKEEKEAIADFNKINLINPNDRMGIEESYLFFKNWKPLRDDVIRMVERHDAQLSSDLMVTRNRVYVSKLFDQMQAIIDTTSLRATAFYNSAQKTKDKIVKSLFILLFISLAVSILSAYLITKSIAKPLNSIVENIREIAKGNLNNKRLDEGPDEIGQLSESFNVMQDDLLLKAKIAQQIAQGDFSIHVKASGRNDIVAESINMIADNFGQVVKQAQKVAAGDFEAEITGIAQTNPLAIVITQMLDSLKEVVSKAKQVAQGDYSGQIIPKSQSDELARTLNQMTAALRVATEQNAKQNRLKTAQNELNEQMRGDLALDAMAKNIISYLAKYTNAQIGAIYLYMEEQKGYQLMGSYAFLFRKGVTTFFKEGESLIGQAAMENEIITFNELPENYVRITSGIGDAIPRNIIIAPFTYENKTIGVIELGSVARFSDEAYEFLKMVLENIAISVVTASNRTKMSKLLAVTQEQAEEMQVQQEELKSANEELEAQTQALKKSEEYLQSQQEELKVTNEELEEKTRRLEEHKVRMEKQNQDLETARIDIERKAKELEITNKYKSEFLANMSHELRTPLNSLLILSETLKENKDNNLTPQQVESAEVIFSSGKDLLDLINDILDLSKIESGKMNLSLGNVSLTQIEGSLRAYFEHIIREKGLEFDIKINADVPAKIVTDEQRLNQILRNLMSNAIKFTAKGGIYVNIFKPNLDEDLSRSGLIPDETIAFSVKDTGIGIPLDKQLEIFEAFQQVDGSISRKYGGTGLGLSITRELTKLLGGEIKLTSELDKGSEFIIFIPVKRKESPVKKTTYAMAELRDSTSDVNEKQHVQFKRKIPENGTKKTYVTSIPDDRQHISPQDPAILIIEDDINFAGLLSKICKDKGFQYLASATGEEGIELAKQFKPKGIILDVKLPEMDGLEVLGQLKNMPETRHIPVHFISAYDETLDAFNKGAIGFLTKPVTKEKLEAVIDEMQVFVTRKIKDLLLIDDDELLRKSTRNLLEAKDIEITESSTAAKAIALISSKHFDCIVLDLGLPDMTGFDMLKVLKEKDIKIPPVVVYTSRKITSEENEELQQYTRNIIIKGVKSEERLLDETALFLHRVVNEMPDRQKNMLINLYDKDEMFRGKNILIVDDDMRNVFAITRVLEAGHMQVFMAPNGQKALETLDSNPNIDLILMDIMMPVMDGYDAMKRIRKNKQYKNIPIIVLTAKAMKEDREKSLAAGANDYLSKPVDTQKLFNLMRIWLYQ